jgi:hypothetical protein
VLSYEHKYILTFRTTAYLLLAKRAAKPKISKISISKLKLKVQNIYIKPLLKLKDNCNASYYETANLDEKVKKIA